VSTGLLTDARLRPELSAVAQHIKTWRDVELPAGQARNALIDAHPYLGPSFEFQEQVRWCVDLERTRVFYTIDRGHVVSATHRVRCATR
jgi:hypothetical protein